MVKRQRKQGWEMIEDSNIGSESLTQSMEHPKAPGTFELERDDYHSI